MPKLNLKQLTERLYGRIKQLEAGEEVAAKDIAALLTVEQRNQLDADWQIQQELRAGKRATTERQRQEFGWKSKREVRLNVLRQALADAERQLLGWHANKQQELEIRQTRIYMKTFGEATDEGKPVQQARNMANNKLTQSGLPRMDGQQVNHQSMRDKEVFEMEAKLKKMLATSDKKK